MQVCFGTRVSCPVCGQEVKALRVNSPEEAHEQYSLRGCEHLVATSATSSPSDTETWAELLGPRAWNVPGGNWRNGWPVASPR